MIRKYCLVLVFAALSLGGCEASRPNLLPSGDAAYKTLAVKSGDEDDKGDIRVIRAGDRLAIRVLGEPDLTSEFYTVDGNGYIEMPLVGEVPAAGRNPGELRDDLVRRLAKRFIRDPQVAVIVLERYKMTFAVEGDVASPGVFQTSATDTLLSAIAQAKSPTNTARLNEVMIFRQVGGERMGARFNLTDIRHGRADDPKVLAGDMIVVGHSNVKGAWREFLLAAPAFGAFYYLKNL